MNLQGDINYRLLPAKVAQQTLMLVSQNVKSFFSALADYKEHPEKYFNTLITTVPSLLT
jgi:putative transposase